MKYAPSEYAKAIVGAAVAGLTALGTALADTEGVSAAEAVAVAVAVLATFGGVFQTRNRAHTVHRQHQPRGQWRSESGHIEGPLTWLLYGLVALFLIVLIVNVLDGGKLC